MTTVRPVVLLVAILIMYGCNRGEAPSPGAAIAISGSESMTLGEVFQTSAGEKEIIAVKLLKSGIDVRAQELALIPGSAMVVGVGELARECVMVRVGILDERAHAYLESWLTADAMKGPDGRKKDYDGRKWYVYYKSTIGTIYGPGAISERQVKPLMDFVGAWENQ